VVTGIELRPAVPQDYGFARAVHVETLRPYVSAWGPWDEDARRAEFDALWRPENTSIILSDSIRVGWLEIRETREEIFLKQLFVAPPHQRQGIGSAILRHLIEEWAHTGKPMALFVLKNNPAVSLYKRFGFRVTGEIDHRFIMHRAAAREARPCALAVSLSKG
jgi:ribosomal protein S18 acetylase RimI-like enzyme